MLDSYVIFLVVLLIWYGISSLVHDVPFIINFFNDHARLRNILSYPFLWFVPAIFLNIFVNAFAIDSPKIFVLILFSVGSWFSSKHFYNAHFAVQKANYEKTINTQSGLIELLMKTTPEKELKKAYYSNS